MALRRFIDRITKPVDELDRIAIAEWSEDVEAVPIDRIEMRRPVFVAGEVSSVRIVPSRTSSALEVTVRDGHGSVTAVFLGRRSIPGLSTGRRVLLEGVPQRQRGRTVILNPVYRIVPRGRR
jgi:RecG-like helicase